MSKGAGQFSGLNPRGSYDVELFKKNSFAFYFVAFDLIKFSFFYSWRLDRGGSKKYMVCYPTTPELGAVTYSVSSAEPFWRES